MHESTRPETAALAPDVRGLPIPSARAEFPRPHLETCQLPPGCQLFTVKQAGSFLSCSPATVRRMVGDGTLGSVLLRPKSRSRKGLRVRLVDLERLTSAAR